MTNKGTLTENNIIIEAEQNEKIKLKDGNEFEIKKSDLIKQENVLVELFNKHYINIVEKTSGKFPSSKGDPQNPSMDRETVKKNLNKYKDHESILQIKENVECSEPFDFPKATTEDINLIIRSLDTKKATGPDRIPIKIIKLAVNLVDSHMANIINSDIERNRYSDEAKKAIIVPLYKKDDRNKIKNYRPVSILNGLSKVYERYLHNSLIDFIEKSLSKYISAYRKKYSSNHVLLRLIEDWKKNLDD